VAKNLVIVESPAKAKTINKFLGKDFKVKASMGHVRDLPKNPKKKEDKDWIGIDEKKSFRPHYEVLPDKKKVVDELLRAAEDAEAIFLATDPDREGEAIGWHIAEILRGKKLDKPVQRILFNEITRKAVQEAIHHGGPIDGAMVEAQETRRILDRIVGYRLSPLLWDKVRRGLSAGRVQTVAVRMIVDRENEIRAFRTTEYWTVAATLEPGGRAPFEARLVRWRGDKAPWKKEDGDLRIAALPDEAAAQAVVAHAAAHPFVVESIEAKRSKSTSPPPFITSKLQQEAARRFRFTVRRTMSLAQALYEGKEIGDEGLVGLITYMRTDSTRVADEALTAVREHIARAYGADYLPPQPRTFRQSKAAQDAHEAIRPTSMEHTPETLARYLNADELKLYTLIWNRFVASQMNPAEFDVTTVEVRAGEAEFRAEGRVLRFPGWLAVYQETREEDVENGEPEEGSLPALQEKERLAASAVTPTQNFTQPPARYTEASLVKALEENGIGRPSTYASILSVISSQEYVEKRESRFFPTRLGEIVVEQLVRHFPDIFEVGYTAELERELDQIEEGKKGKLHTLEEFNGKFAKDLATARKDMENIKARKVPTDQKCEVCGNAMVIRFGRFGEFLTCEDYPKCKNSRDLHENGKPAIDVDETCPECGGEMVLRNGKWGPFLACTKYPSCKGTRKVKVTGDKVEVKREVVLEDKCPRCGKNLSKKHGRAGEFIGCTGYPECRYIKQDETGVSCPQCGKMVVGRKSKRGKTFFGCSGYPACEFVLWKRPVSSPCPSCGRAYRLESVTKKSGRQLLCDAEGCGHKETLEPGSGPRAATAR